MCACEEIDKVRQPDKGQVGISQSSEGNLWRGEEGLVLCGAVCKKRSQSCLKESMKSF